MLTLKDFGVVRKETTLSNGCRLVVFERKNAPVALSAHFFSGSRFDPINKDGTAHFLEHMLLAGTKSFPTKDKLAEYIEQYGGWMSAYTNADEICINVEIGDPTDLNKAVKVLNEILLYPLFEESTIKNEHKSILREIGERKSNPSITAWDVYSKLFFQGTPVGRVITGSEESLKEISKKDLLHFYKNMLTSGRMILTISGGVNINKLKEMAEASLLLPKSEAFITKDDLPIIRKNPIMIERYKGLEQVHIFFGFRTTNIFDEKINDILDIVASVIGGGRASTLTKKLRYEKGLIYSISAFQSSMIDYGTFSVKTSTSKSRLQEVMNIITEELKRVADSGVTEKELAFAKNRTIKLRRLQMQTSESWRNFHSYDELVGKKGWTLIDYLKGIEQVQNEDVKQVARKYFLDNKWYLAMCGDVESDDIKINL